MKLKMRIMYFLFLYITNLSLNSKEIQTPKWSIFQGRMSWENAKTRCDSMGMKLPSKLELKNAFKKNLTKSWNQDSAVFWAEEEFSINEAFDHFVSYNPIYWTSDENTIYEAYGFHTISGNYYKNSKLYLASVRCIALPKKGKN